MKYLFVFLIIPLLGLSQEPSLGHAKSLMDAKNYVKAVEALKTYVANHKNDREAIELLGDAYGYQKKWDEAASNYKRLVELDQSNANYHYKYGGSLGMKALSVSKLKALGIIGDVKEAFLKAADLDPNHIDTRWALVELYMQLPGIVGGSKSKSLKYANELELLSKVDGYLAKGYIHEYDDEPELAEKYYRLAIEEGGSLTCYDKLTALYEKSNQPDRAISNLEASGIKHERNAMHYQIGKVCAEYNIQLDKGERCLLVYIENHSAKDGVPKAWAYYRLAQIYKYKNDKEDALKWINKAIVSLPKIDVFRKEKSQIESL
ncbi:MAG: tetratricopeptide repeat protein [Algicola sp.]|nr:tetratricopeptide repeat protein [Algicola sp.]